MKTLDGASSRRRAEDLCRGGRAILGMAGAPGSGKSTYAAGLVAHLSSVGHRVAMVPMDGFHLAHAVLVERGDVAVKGAPRTFDAAGYAALLQRLHSETHHTVWAPAFDRELEDPVAGSIAVDRDVTLVITEGNYLLLDDGEWAGVRPLLDECWYVDVPDELRRARLAARHRNHGRSPEEAMARTLGSDEANALVVRASRDRADAVVSSA